MTERKRVLLAEENEDLREMLAVELRSAGYEVVEVEDGLELEDYLEEVQAPVRPCPAPNVIVSDASMSGRGGLDVLARLQDHSSTTPFILLNWSSNEEVRDRARRLRAAFVLEGPVNPRELCNAVCLSC